MDITNVATLSPDRTGLPSPLEITGPGPQNFGLRFGGGVTTDGPDIRFAPDLEAFLRDASRVQADDVLYAIYRGIRSERLTAEMDRRGLTYVIAILRPGTINGTDEWVRTRGHTNSAAPGTNYRYPEVHEVMSGDGLLYLQNGVGACVEEVVTIPLCFGDKIVVAPGWASMLVNIGTAPLVVGTLRMADCATEGAALMQMGGMAHYIVPDVSGVSTYVENPHYRSIPTPRTGSATERPEWGLSRSSPLLAAFHENPEFVRFLLRPQDFDTSWKTLYD